MYCQNQLIYTVQAGDSLYRLAKTYHTTVSDLILGNSEVNPYNLQVGMKLKICPGEAYPGAEPEDLPRNQEGHRSEAGGPERGAAQKAMSWTEISSKDASEKTVSGRQEGNSLPEMRPQPSLYAAPEERYHPAAGDGQKERETSEEEREPSVTERPAGGKPDRNEGNPFSEMPQPLYAAPEERYHPAAGDEQKERKTSEEEREPFVTERSLAKDAEKNVREPSAVAHLGEKMQAAWLDHVYWTHILLLSSGMDVSERHVAEEVLLRTADEIADVFALFLPVTAIRQLRNLLTEHVELGGEVIDALRAGRRENYDSLIREWYANLNKLAVLLGEQEPYTDSVRKIRNLLLQHLDLTREEIEFQIRGECQKGVEAFWRVRDQALAMAEFLAEEAGADR